MRAKFVIGLYESPWFETKKDMLERLMYVLDEHMAPGHNCSIEIRTEYSYFDDLHVED